MFPWGKFPFNEDLKKMTEQMKPNDIQSYVNEMIKKYIPSQWENSAETETANPFNASTTNQGQQAKPDVDVFETFDYVFIRIKLQSEEQQKQLKFFHTSNQAIIENFHEMGDRHTITLPCLVKRKGATALVKDLILEVQIPKNVDMQYTEVDISEKL
ncbi:spore germination protein GerT [Siminovitchia terrae]|uniref:Hsp20/alpha crystallin family protein n=1 Tax=Siminovitchia terrae TaxID=1914933 RepID=A0A429X3G7_SIMTE|nr:Hsp20/alpha crystallin family protein [Siminovitchia terrae]RST57919.1 Hsp20/alpha crystallin family protein [Siminovitchia terrae]GIN91041.1 spore germination protein GerT [Siminovitchia terrae]GIN99234.1 spore germination protein GerT [Siminovitchia terrae]